MATTTREKVIRGRKCRQRTILLPSDTILSIFDIHSKFSAMATEAGQNIATIQQIIVKTISMP
jgi:hypothetical protein